MNLTDNDLRLLKEKYPHNLEDILKKIKNNYPIQYLIGNVNFYGYPINVDESVLIPRFETEQLVEKTIDLIKKYNFLNASVLDMATGSGCIAITLKKELPTLKIEALDYSVKALKKASENINLNNVDISLFKHDILKDTLTKKYDLIISNPPYVPKNQPVEKNIAYEPQDAIFASHNGLLFYEKIASIAPNIVHQKSIIALEINYDQKQQVIALFQKKFPKSKIFCQQDYNGFDRFIFILSNCE